MNQTKVREYCVKYKSYPKNGPRVQYRNPSYPGCSDSFFCPGFRTRLTWRETVRQVGTICLSVSLAAVDESKWGLLAVEPVQTSWGVARLFIHEKIAA